MNYQLIYDKLIAKCKLRGLDKTLLDGYYEKHHIVPRCLGGSDEDSNLVLLTGREHFVAHRLLAKANPQILDLTRAVVIFSKGPAKRSLNSRQVSITKSVSAALLRQLSAQGVHPWQTDKHRKATSARMSKYQRKLVADGTHPWQTPEHAEDRRQAITAYNLSDQNPSKKPENRAKSAARAKTLHKCQFCQREQVMLNFAKTCRGSKCSSLYSHVVLTHKDTGEARKHTTLHWAEVNTGTRLDRVLSGERKHSRGWTAEVVNVSLIVPE